MESIEPFDKPMYITQPLLPDLEELLPMYVPVWESKQLTNNASLSRKLETELQSYLGVNHLSLFCNGTVALQIACRVLRLSGEVITTPFTFAATPHALAWNNLTPVFCDIESDTFNIDAEKIEALITEKTSAILPVHVFGIPCNISKINSIACKYGLKVLYDAAHCFGVKVYDKPIGSFGDISMFSFHSTKIFHTVEGGALTFNNIHYKERADILRNFGINGDANVSEPGTNGKLNELQSGMGLLLLKLIEKEIEKRKQLTYLYRVLLHEIPGISYRKDIPGVTHNYPYFTLCIDTETFGLSRDALCDELKKYNIIARKYFYPLCSDFQCYRHLPTSRELPEAQKVSGSILALPLHGSLEVDDVERICDIIRYIRKQTLN